MAFEIDIGFASQAGKKDSNEDFVAAMLPEPGQEAMGAIAAIADGVSQGGMGREAAQTTVTSLVRDYYGTPETWDTTVALDRIIAAQNAWLAGINRRRAPVLGLTTLTALVVRGQSYTLAHVGDSRAYLLRAGEVLPLTTDHIVNHPDLQHQLLRAVGIEDRLVVDYSQGDVQVGDVFLLLTDGVHNKVAAKRLPDFAKLPDAKTMSEALIEQALKQGSLDNVTALVVRVLGLSHVTLQDENRKAQQLPVLGLLKVGDVVDGLTVTAVVADNGINIVYQVRELAPAQGVGRGKLYAIKTLHPQRARDVEERAMLAHEAWLARRMQSSRASDNLVALAQGAAVPTSPSGFYLLYDWHAGETLQQMLDRHHRFSLPQAIGVATQAARALGHLHRQNVIHRDIKPSNLHQGEDGVLRLLDLGVALSGREPEAARLLHAGSPSYMNPEQWGFAIKASGLDTSVAPVAPDAQSDLFALGVTLYQLLCGGKLPYGEVLPYQSGRYYRDPIAPSRHNPEVPIWLDHIVRKAVARDRRQRFETAEELLLALERGAARPLNAPQSTPLLQRDPTAVWKLALGLSLLFNLMLVFWLLFLPK
jgi:serine/threonine protein phosphatase PrpC